MILRDAPFPPFDEECHFGDESNTGIPFLKVPQGVTEVLLHLLQDQADLRVAEPGKHFPRLVFIRLEGARNETVLSTLIPCIQSRTRQHTWYGSFFLSW